MPNSNSTNKGDLINNPSYIASYTKGLPHDSGSGLIDNLDQFYYFVKGIDSGDPRDFRDKPLGRRNNVLGAIITGSYFNWQSNKPRKISCPRFLG